MSGNGRATCPLYDGLDTILGTMAAPCPPVVLESRDFVVRATNQPDKAESASDPPLVVDIADGLLCENCYEFAWLRMLV